MSFLFTRRFNAVDGVVVCASGIQFAEGHFVIALTLCLLGDVISVWGERRLERTLVEAAEGIDAMRERAGAA